MFGFAPFGLSFLPVVTLAMLVALWQGAASARTAAAIGYAFGLGLFGAGASWVFIALHTFGGMPGVLAAIGTAGFCAFLALYPAAAGWLAVRWTRGPFVAARGGGRSRVDGGGVGDEASSSRDFRGSRSATRRCPAARRVRSPRTRRSAACSWSRFVPH